MRLQMVMYKTNLFQNFQQFFLERIPCSLRKGKKQIDPALIGKLMGVLRKTTKLHCPCKVVMVIRCVHSKIIDLQFKKTGRLYICHDHGSLTPLVDLPRRIHRICNNKIEFCRSGLSHGNLHLSSQVLNGPTTPNTESQRQ